MGWGQQEKVLWIPSGKLGNFFFYYYYFLVLYGPSKLAQNKTFYVYCQLLCKQQNVVWLHQISLHGFFFLLLFLSENVSVLQRFLVSVPVHQWHWPNHTKSVREAEPQKQRDRSQANVSSVKNFAAAVSQSAAGWSILLVSGWNWRSKKGTKNTFVLGPLFLGVTDIIFIYCFSPRKLKVVLMTSIYFIMGPFNFAQPTITVCQWWINVLLNCAWLHFISALD